MTVAAAEAGVKIIHCEKPIATTWGDCKRMKAAADANGAKLSFGHQRRHIKMFQQVREEVRQGAIGELVMIEAQVGDMFDWGTHWLDMMQLYNEETPIEWVLGQIESKEEKQIFGALMEEQAFCCYKWKNGVRGYLTAGNDTSIGCVHRLIGTKGTLEVLNERSYRLIGNGRADWQYIEVPQGDLHEHLLSAQDVIRQLDEPGHKSLLSSDYAMQHTEAIFATYYSSLIRGRVDLPMQYEGNALLEMLESGAVGPNRKS
jgi:predicted dehydrogenase